MSCLSSANLDELCVGIIGGSGLDDPDLLEEREEISVKTPYGQPSDVLIRGKIKGIKCLLLARHGRKHTIQPTAINNRANIYALKASGCNLLLVSTSCGSLNMGIKPGHLATIDQFIDRTTKRVSTFYDGSVEQIPGVMHIPMANPFSSLLMEAVRQSVACLGLEDKYHATGTMVCVEGPRFSTRAESNMCRSWGADLVNMTTVPEVCLAAEAGLPYCAICLVTDYDSWRQDIDPVSTELIVKTLAQNCTAVILLPQ